MSTPLRVLIIEDSEDDMLLQLRELRRGGYEPTWLRVQSAAELQAALQQGEWQLILSDYTLPGFNGLEALQLVQASGLDIPFILISGTVGEEIAVQSMRAGAHDYLLKNSLMRLGPAVHRSLRDAAERQRRRQAEDQQRRLEVQLAQAQKLEALGTMASGIAHDFNNILAGISGYAELVRDDAQDNPQIQESIQQILQGIHRATDLARRILAFSRKRTIQRRAMHLGPVVTEALAFLRPLIPPTVVVQANLPAECPPVLADAGQMHQVLINLCTNAVQAMTNQESGESRSSGPANAAGQQGSGESRSSGPANGAGQQGSGESRSSGPANGAGQQGSGVSRSSGPANGAGQQGSGVSRSSGPANGAGQQGTLTVALEAVSVTADLVEKHASLRPGGHVRLMVSDTGCGMDQATLDRLFEPFFTTKQTGIGTGLGMAVVQGIVKNHQGAITVRSALGQGTTFELYFPLAEEAVPAVGMLGAQVRPGQGERILFVDDEEYLTAMGAALLARLGYRASVFTDPEQALAAFVAEPSGFDVLVTDLTMPGLKGTELASRMRQLRPDLPIVLITGYCGPHDLDRARSLGFHRWLEKPFTAEKLSNVLCLALGRTEAE